MPDILDVIVGFHDFQHLFHVLDVVLGSQRGVGLGRGLPNLLLDLKRIFESRFLHMFCIVKNEHLA